MEYTTGGAAPSRIVPPAPPTPSPPPSPVSRELPPGRQPRSGGTVEDDIDVSRWRDYIMQQMKQEMPGMEYTTRTGGIPMAPTPEHQAILETMVQNITKAAPSPAGAPPLRSRQMPPQISPSKPAGGKAPSPTKAAPAFPTKKPGISVEALPRELRDAIQAGNTKKVRALLDDLYSELPMAFGDRMGVPSVVVEREIMNMARRRRKGK